jgi:hypothetical protein
MILGHDSWCAAASATKMEVDIPTSPRRGTALCEARIDVETRDSALAEIFIN